MAASILVRYLYQANHSTRPVPGVPGTRATSTPYPERDSEVQVNGNEERRSVLHFHQQSIQEYASKYGRQTVPCSLVNQPFRGGRLHVPIEIGSSTGQVKRPAVFPSYLPDSRRTRKALQLS